MKLSRPKQVIGYLWLLSILIGITSLIILYFLRSSIAMEQKILHGKLEMLSAATQLQRTMVYLTSQVRGFSVTNKPEHLRNFWNEVLILKNREKSIEILKRLSDNKKNIDSLIQSKRLSDALIDKQLRSMRLVLEAYDVPMSLMPERVSDFELSAKDKNLSPEGKIILSQKLLFDKKHFEQKKRISKLIQSFIVQLQKETGEKLTTQSQMTNYYIILLNIFLWLQILIVISIIWIRSSSEREQYK